MEIKFNTQFSRWEVYGEKSVIRGGELQPVFVSANHSKAEEFIKKA